MDREDSRALVAKATLQCHYSVGLSKEDPSKQNISIAVQQLELFKCAILHEADTSVSIIEPFDISLNYSAQKTKR